MSIITSIRAELLARKGTWRDICNDTHLSYWWLTKFAQGRISNPGATNLEVLKIYFEQGRAAFVVTGERRDDMGTTEVPGAKDVPLPK
jgi:hypothetical protein